MVGRLLEGMTFAERVLLGVGIFVGSSLVSLAAVTAVLVSLPPGYFRHDAATMDWPRSPVLRALWRVGKNLLGLALVALEALLFWLLPMILRSRPPASGATPPAPTP